MNINQEKIDALIIEGYENELKGISSYLHEEVAQNLYAVFNHLQYLQQQQGDSQDRSTIDDMVKLTKKTIEDIRLLSNDAHPFFHKGVDGALKTILTNMNKQYGLLIDYKEFGEKKRLPLLTELMIYRSIKEIIHQMIIRPYPEQLNVSLLWGDSLHINMEFILNQIVKEEADSFLRMMSIEKKLNMIGGIFSVINTSKTKKVASILIPIVG